MPFSFLNPAFLWGLLGAGVPLALHLLGRRKGREVRFAALAFLLASERRLRAHRKVHELVLLALRMALVASLALLLARPLVERAVVARMARPVSAVAILDRTASMGAMRDGQSLFARGCRLLEQAVARMAPGSEVLVLSLERRPRDLTGGFVSPAQAARALGGLEPGFETGRLARVLREARARLEGAHHAERLVYLVSDLQRATMATGELGALSPTTLPVVVLDAAGGEPVGANLGVVGFRLAPPGGAARAVDVEVLRTGAAASPALEVPVGIREDGEPVNRGLLRFTGQGLATTGVELASAARDGVVELVAEIGLPDVLAADDRRYLLAGAARAVRVLIADGAPSPDLYQDEVFYLERALQSLEGRFEVGLVDASAGGLGSLDGVGVVVLANVARVSTDDAKRLEEHVTRGGGLLVTAGDRVDPEALNRTLGDLLPARLTGHAALRPGEAPLGLVIPGGPAGRGRPDPVLAPFDSSLGSESLATPGVRELFHLEPRPDARVLLATTGGNPLLVEAARGAGRVALLATSIDRDWTDLPVKPAYLPVVTRLVLSLGGALEDPRPREFRPGDTVRLPGELAREEPQFLTPRGRTLPAARLADSSLEVAVVEEPGFYRAREGGAREPRLDFVVNLDPEESHLERVDPAKLEALLGPGRRQPSGGRLVTEGREVRYGTLVAVILLFAVESVVAGLRVRAAPVAGS